MNSLCYLLLLSGVFGKNEIDPMLLCLLFALPGMGLGATTGTLGASPMSPTLPLPPPAPVPTTLPTTPTSVQTGACAGPLGLDPLLVCFLFSGGLFGERRGRRFPAPGFRSEKLERKDKE